MFLTSATLPSRPRALLLYGGWEEHRPGECADFAAKSLLPGFDVVRSQDLSVLRDDVLNRFDLLVPIWTFGEITADQEASLLTAVERGLGLVAWHGFASAFTNSRLHKFLLGGQFVSHPGGSSVRYVVRFRTEDPLTRGLPDLTVTTEQYYLLVDPAVEVVAGSHINGGEQSWLAGVEMPAAWKRSWGAGRVFYCSLGHSVDMLRVSSLKILLRRAARWAARKNPGARRQSSSGSQTCLPRP